MKGPGFVLVRAADSGPTKLAARRSATGIMIDSNWSSNQRQSGSCSRLDLFEG